MGKDHDDYGNSITIKKGLKKFIQEINNQFIGGRVCKTDCGFVEEEPIIAESRKIFMEEITTGIFPTERKAELDLKRKIRDYTKGKNQWLIWRIYPEIMKDMDFDSQSNFRYRGYTRMYAE